MGLFQWGEKRFARGIAKAMIRSFLLYKTNDPNLNELGLVRQALSDRPGNAAKELLKELDDNEFWVNTAGSSFFEVVYLLVRMEYLEHMKGTIVDENIKTLSIFKDVIKNEFTNSNL